MPPGSQILKIRTNTRGCDVDGMGEDYGPINGGTLVVQFLKYVLIIIGFVCIISSDINANPNEHILEGAYLEVRNKTRYNTDMLTTYVSPTYLNGKNTGKAVYPNGDVDPDQGICADLVVRALRHAGIDLQQSVHEDILNQTQAYGVNTPDKYIDHRRVWILQTYFKRKWQHQSTELTNPADWQPGDVVIWDTGSKKHLHIGIIGRKKRSDGWPHVIHNMRSIPFIFKGKTIEQDILMGPTLLWFSMGNWTIIGHYRLK